MATRSRAQWQPPLLWMLSLFLGAGCTMPGEPPTAAPAGRAATRSATPGSPDALDILLAQQFAMGGEGAGPVSCRDDPDERPPSRPAAGPRVWVTSGEDTTGASGAVGMGEESLLCLQGFPPGPITVTVKAGGRTYTTVAKPVAELSATPSATDDLFNGRPMEVEDEGGGLLQSGFWSFLPSEPALTDVARSRRFTVAARSGGVRAESEVPLRLPRGAAATEGWEHNHRIAVYGYPAGARVPIGLYLSKGQEADRTMVLRREVGRVVMPRHQVAIFTVPPDVFRAVNAEPAGDGNGDACLSVADLATCVT
ncbi:hypothetical protein WDV06_11745 [Streptomyces racemochromogenes]|uniref:Lipoprotein n=1 Tax=Streptomyces racemochromogenes TaxID=67353 RepID=A0ABW7PCN6_9ACTN